MPDTADITLAERLQGLGGRALGLLPAPVQLKLSGRPPIEVDGQRLDSCLQLLLAVNRRRKRHGLCEPDPVTARARFRREVLVYGGPKTRVGPVRDFEIEGGAGPVRVRHYAPPPSAPSDKASRDLLVYLHGGGFVLGDLETHDEPCRLLCLHARTHVLSVAYRLAPEHPFPAGLGDALAALRWAQSNAGRLGVEPERVSIGGDSAGGNLAAVAAQVSARDRPPAAQLLVYPATDAVKEERPSKELFGRGFFLARTDCDAFFDYYTGGEGREDPRVSPLRAPDLSGLAPALVVIAGFDYLRDEGDAYARALEEAGGVVVTRRLTSLAHGFIHMTGVCPAARAALVAYARGWRALLERVARAPVREVLREEAAP
ncbi:MAG: alpha/beta hydrolase [Pyrinomonadaceae bacterium]